MRFKISRAQTRIKTGLNSTKKQIQKKSKADGAVIKRTWLKDVDYKNGGLLSENKKKLSEKKANAKRNQNENEINDNEPDMQEPKQKKKKSNFLSKSHKEEHDNIFSKKFKQNKFEDKRRKKK